MPIGELMAEFHDGPHATPKPSAEGPVFLGIKNLTDAGNLDLSAVRHIAPEDFTRWTTRVTPQQDDIVFTHEATLHRYALIPRGFHGCLGRRRALIRPHLDRADPRYLHQALRSPAWRSTVEERVILSSSERTLTAAGVAAGSRVVDRDAVLFVVRGMSLVREVRAGIADRSVAFGQDCKALSAGSTWRRRHGRRPRG
jgi:hypothetical protein